jgi:phosphomannomutase
MDRYVEHVLSFVDEASIKPFNVVLDAGSGVAGIVAPRLFDRLPCKTSGSASRWTARSRTTKRIR